MNRPPVPTTKNGKKLAAYFEQVNDLPYHSGQPDKTNIAVEASLANREPLYKSNDCVRLCEYWFPRIPERIDVDTEKLKQKNRRINLLEKGDDNLVAEVHELRRQLSKLQHIESLIEEGKRYIP